MADLVEEGKSGLFKRGDHSPTAARRLKRQTTENVTEP